jgi:hypothetical protein
VVEQISAADLRAMQLMGYTLVAVTPEPGGVIFFGIVAVGLLARRRPATVS